jgi:hypothetical protein
MNSLNGYNIHVEFVGRIAQKKRIIQFVRDTITHFMPRMRRLVDIEITTVDKCQHEYFALCWGNRNSVEIEIARGSEEDEFDIDEMMLNLAHELIHAKQFLRGDLSANLRWTERKMALYEQYMSQPWEREAYNKEGDIYEKYWKKP